MKILLYIQNLILGQKNKLTKWEEEQLEIGLKDLDSGKRIPHKTVMKKINEILK
jgi:predicted transcriptional regulator